MYIVIEIQQTANDKVNVLTYTYADAADAENKYHTILAYAAKSDVLVHTAAMMNETGTLIKKEFYMHPQEVTE